MFFHVAQKLFQVALNMICKVTPSSAPISVMHCVNQVMKDQFTLDTYSLPYLQIFDQKIKAYPLDFQILRNELEDYK